MSDNRIRVLGSLAEMDAIAEDWRALEARCGCFAAVKCALPGESPDRVARSRVGEAQKRFCNAARFSHEKLIPRRSAFAP